MSEPILRTDGLTKRFGGLTAVDNLSFNLAGGRGCTPSSGRTAPARPRSSI